MRLIAIKRLAVVLLAALPPVALAACGEVVATSSFKGENKAVAQIISNFQNDVSTANKGNICQKDLASALTARLNSASGGCQEVIKNQLGQIDTFSLNINSITVKGSSAQAQVKSTYSGKTRVSTLTLVKEGGKWKVSGVRAP
ncbi:MAG: nuclear transport factor 2 family protein [Solirubrobacteraceae bacterium]